MGDGIDQGLGIWLGRIVQHMVRGTGFNDASPVHHDHPFAQQAHHVQILEDENCSYFWVALFSGT